MSHTPPVPAGNTSPYPLQDQAQAPANKALDHLKASKKGQKHRPQSGAIVGVAVGAGILAAAVAYLVSSWPPAKRRKRR